MIHIGSVLLASEIGPRAGGTAEPLRISSVLTSVLVHSRAPFVVERETEHPQGLLRDDLQSRLTDIREEHC
jgi:hypothetical protein